MTTPDPATLRLRIAERLGWTTPRAICLAWLAATEPEETNA